MADRLPFKAKQGTHRHVIRCVGTSSDLGETYNAQKPVLLQEKIGPQTVRTAPLTVFGHHRYQANDLKLFSDPVKSETMIFIVAPGGFMKAILRKALDFRSRCPSENGNRTQSRLQEHLRGPRSAEVGQNAQPRQGNKIKIKSEAKRLTSSVPQRRSLQTVGVMAKNRPTFSSGSGQVTYVTLVPRLGNIQ